MESILEFSLGVYVVIGIIFFLFLKMIFRFSSSISFYIAVVLTMLLLEFPWVILTIGFICSFMVKKRKSKYMTVGLTILLFATGYLLSYEKDKVVKQDSLEGVLDSVRKMESLEKEDKNEGQTNKEEEAQVVNQADVPNESNQSVETEIREEDNLTDIVEVEKSESKSEANENAVDEESPYSYEEVVYEDGSSYKGNFVNGVYHGYGMLIWADGTKYDGDFANGYFHGEGTLTWPDGMIYKGEFRNDLQNGYGEMFWPDGTMFKGTFIDGNYTENGEWVYPE
ncbi:hypothetical protein J2Y03_004608 [Neobacillus niacini]|uniref:hypothetical protein n=1 Tax=Neobacillus niacini TaxID=86668 RepID=UPI002856409A|nr:hypothetical protein [Neobacillus niacini]MDR7079550.1 hypothetical protein [Neobacillus niacini]